MSPLRPLFHQTPLLSSFLVFPFGTVNPTLADRSRGYFIFIRPPKLYGLEVRLIFYIKVGLKPFSRLAAIECRNIRQLKG